MNARVLRSTTNLLMWIALAVGIWALVGGQWAVLAVAAFAFIGIGIVFVDANQAVDKRARDDVAKDLDRIGFMVDTGDWNGALTATNRAVKELSDTVRVGGKHAENRGPLAAMLLLQSSVIGVTGDSVGSRFAAGRAVAILERVESPTPFAEELIQVGRELQHRAGDRAFCAHTASALTS